MAQKTAAQIAEEKKQRGIEIKAAQDAYEAFEVKGPEDLAKKFDLQKALFELKGADGEKNLAEKMEALELKMEEAKTATEEKAAAIAEEWEIQKKAFDYLQTRVKTERKTFKPEVKSFGQHVKDEMESKSDEVAKFIKGETTKLQLDIKGGNAPVEEKAVADFSTANVTGGSVWGAIYRPGIIPNPNQINHIRNFIPTYPAGPGTDFYFMKENGVGEGAPAPTAEKQAAAATNPATGLKPSFDIDLIEASVKFETIAGIMIASKKALNNIPNFMQFLNMRVPEKLLDVEDEQILYGNGTTPNLKGILTSGNFTASTSTATTLSEAIIDDMGDLMDTYKRYPTQIFMRPKPYLDFFKQKASGSGEFDLPRNVVFVGNKLYISGIEVVPTTALTVGDYYIESRDGVELYVQEGVRMEFFNQHASLAATNQIMIRIEETVALPVYGATYRIKGTVPDAS